MSKYPTTILLIGKVATLTVIRSLAKAGHRIIIGRDGPKSIFEYSRYISETWQHPLITGTGNLFMRALEQFLSSRLDVSLVFPLGDEELDVLAKHSDMIPHSVKIVMPDPSVVLTCLDKAALCRIVSLLGIPQARFSTVSNLSELKQEADTIGYPCVVKSDDQLFRVFGQKAIICETSEQFEAIFPSWPEGNKSLLIQRFISGPRHNIEFFAHEGKLLSSVEYKVLRTARPDYTGLTVDCVTVEPSANLHEDCRRLVAHLNYSGVGCAQFLIDEEQDSSSFLEINPRLGHPYVIAYRCGIDFPRMAVDLFQGGPINRSYPTEYPVGIRMAWSHGDIHGFFDALGTNEIGSREAFSLLGKMVTTFVNANVHVTWSLSDPLPTIVLYCRLFSRIFRMLVRFPFTILKRYSKDNFSRSGEKKS